MIRVRTKTRHIFRWIFAVVGSIVLLAIAALVLTALPPGEKIVRGILEDQLSAALLQPVTLARFETNLLSRIEIDSLIIRADSTPNSPAVLAIGQIRARYRLWPLLSNTVAIDSLRMHSIDLTVTRDTAHSFNLALLDSPAASSSDMSDTVRTDTSESSFTLELGSAVIDNVDLNYTDNALGLEGFLYGLSASLNETSPGAVAFELASDTGSLRYRDSPPGDISVSARGSWVNDALQLDTLAVSLERLRLTAAGAFPMDSSAPIGGSLRLTGNPQTFFDIARAQFELPRVTIDSSLDLSANLYGTVAQPSAKLTLTLPPIHTYGIDIENTYLGADWSGSEVTIDSLMLALFGGAITGTGTAALDTTVATSLHLNLTSINFAALWNGLYQNESPYRGTLNGGMDLATIGADWHDWRAQLDINARNARYQDLPLRDLQIRATVDTGTVVAAITQQHFKLDARVRMDEPNVDGRLTMQVDRLGPLVGLFNIPEVTGALSGSADLSGTIENPRLKADIRGRDINYRNFPIDTIALVASYAESVLTLADLTASGRREQLDSAGPIFDLDSLTGRLDYHAKLSGSLDALTGQLELRLIAPGYRTYRLDSAIIAATLDSGRVDLRAADLYRDSLFVTARGQFKFDGPSGTLDASAYDLTAAKADSTVDTTSVIPPKRSTPHRLVSNFESAFSLPDTGDFTISVRSEGIDLGALEDMLVDSFDVDGIASFDATLRGPVGNLSADLRMTVDRPRYEEVRLDSLTTTVTLANDTLDMSSLRLFGADQSLSGRITAVLARDSADSYTLTPASIVRGKLDIDDFDLRVLEPFLWPDGQLTGSSTVHLMWDGTIGDPNIRGQFALDSVTVLVGPEVEPIERINLVSDIQDTAFTINRASGIVHDTPFEIKGTATLSDGSSLKTDLSMILDTIGTITARGLLSREKLEYTATVKNFNFAFAQPFVTTVTDLGGRLSATVELTGTADAPQLYGRLDIDSLTARYEMLDQPITAGMLKATFTRTKVILDTVDAKIGQGSLSAAGYFTYADSTITDIDIRLEGKNVRIVPIPDFYMVVDSTSLAYTKPDQYFRLAGDIVLGETKYKANLEPTAILSWTRQVEQTPPDFPEVIQQTRLSVRVRNSDNIWIDNNLAHIRLHAELEAVGSIERPNLSGRLAVTEGYLVYLDRKFKITDGVFYFTDPNKINPDLNLVATTSVSTYQALQSTMYIITFSVTGTMEQPRVELTSDPALERADIISLLTLGATRQELAGGNGGSSTGQILQERAEVLASQQISGYVGQRVGNLLGLDEVSVQGNIFNSTDTTGPELVAAKQVSDNLRVTYKTTVGHLNDQAVRINYDIWRHFSLEGQTNRRGEASLNLKYGIRFR